MKELNTIPTDTWAEIYFKLNAWIFPEQLKEVRPEWWIDGDNSENACILKRPVINLFNSYILNVIGRKALLRWNNVVNLKSMNDEEFDKWFESNKADL